MSDWLTVLELSLILSGWSVATPFNIYYVCSLTQCCNNNKRGQENNNNEPITTNKVKNDKKTTYQASICGITSFMITSISYLFLTICWFFMFFDLISWTDGFIVWEAITVLFYFIGIWVMLFTFLLRIDHAFQHNSFLAYPIWLIKCLYIYIIVIGLTMISIVISLVLGHSGPSSHMQWLAPFGCFELITYNMILLYLLFRKVFKIFELRGSQYVNMNNQINIQENSSETIELNTLKTTIIYSTLILLGVVSTLIFTSLLALEQTVDVLPDGLLIALDICVNSTCLYLMFNANKRKYDRYCSKYRNCFQSCCIYCTYKGDITAKKTKEEYTNMVLADSIAMN